MFLTPDIQSGRQELVCYSTKSAPVTLATPLSRISMSAVVLPLMLARTTIPSAVPTYQTL